MGARCCIGLVKIYTVCVNQANRLGQIHAEICSQQSTVFWFCAISLIQLRYDYFSDIIPVVTLHTDMDDLWR